MPYRIVLNDGELDLQIQRVSNRLGQCYGNLIYPGRLYSVNWGQYRTPASKQFPNRLYLVSSDKSLHKGRCLQCVAAFRSWIIRIAFSSPNERKDGDIGHAVKG